MSVAKKLYQIYSFKQNIKQSIIRKGQDMIGVSFSDYSKKIDAISTDATATSQHILSGKTAYSQGSKISGSISTLSSDNFDIPVFSSSNNTITAIYNINSIGYLDGTNFSKANTLTIETLTSDNIKSGISILGINGTFTSDANANTNDILEGKTAYVNGSLITGSISTLTQENFLQPEISYSSNIITASYSVSKGYIENSFIKERNFQIDGLIPDNIKKGITILGIVGISQDGTNTDDANATSTEILNGYTAYVKGSKISGSISTLNQDNFEKPVISYIDNIIQASYIVNQGYVNNSFVKINSFEIQNLKSENIKKDIKILGITGTADGDTNTQDATAISDDILEGKTAYANGSKITGNISSYNESFQIIPGTESKTINSHTYIPNDITIVGDDNLKSDNIKSGESIFGVVGSFNGIDTSDATATSDDILYDKTAYINGQKITGNIQTIETIDNPTFTVTNGIITASYSINKGFIKENKTAASSISDSSLNSLNIKKNVSIFGINGQYDPMPNFNICKVKSYTPYSKIEGEQFQEVQIKLTSDKYSYDQYENIDVSENVKFMLSQPFVITEATKNKSGDQRIYCQSSYSSYYLCAFCSFYDENSYSNVYAYPILDGDKDKQDFYFTGWIITNDIQKQIKSSFLDVFPPHTMKNITSSSSAVLYLGQTAYYDESGRIHLILPELDVIQTAKKEMTQTPLSLIVNDAINFNNNIITFNNDDIILSSDNSDISTVVNSIYYRNENSLLGLFTDNIQTSELDTSDATASENHILQNYTAYVKSSKITGNISTLNSNNFDIPIFTSSSNTITATYNINSFGYLPSETSFSKSNTLTIENLESSNIKNGVNILGIIGTCKQGTSEAIPGYIENNDGNITFHPIEDKTQSENVNILYIVKTGQLQPNYSSCSNNNSTYSVNISTGYIINDQNGIQFFDTSESSNISLNSLYIVNTYTSEPNYSKSGNSIDILAGYIINNEDGILFNDISSSSNISLNSLYTVNTTVNEPSYTSSSNNNSLFNFAKVTNYNSSSSSVIGVIATDYDIELKQWNWSNEQVVFNSYETTPIINGIFATKNNSLIGKKFGIQDIISTDKLLFYSKFNDNQAIQGSFTTNSNANYQSDNNINYINLDNNYITTSVLLSELSGDFTFSAYVNIGNQDRCSIMAAHDADLRIGIDTNGGTYNMWAGNSGWNILQADSGYSGSQTDRSGRSTASVVTNTWQHILQTRQGNYWKLYLNGILNLTKQREGIITTGGYLDLHRWGNNDMITSSFKLGQVRIYSRAITEDEIAIIYNNIISN